MSSKHNFCGECGTPLSGRERFCGACGATVKTARDKNGDRQTKIEKKKKRKVLPPADQREKQKQPSNSANFQKSFEIVSLLFWACVWSGSLIIGSILLLVRDSWYFFHFFSESIWIWFITGLLAAAFLQWFQITTRNPTGKMVGVIILSWGIFMFAILWAHLDGILIVPPVGALVGFLLGWIITKQVSITESKSFTKSSRMKLMGGWALCGVCGGIPYWRLSSPYEGLITAFLFIALMAAIMLKHKNSMARTS